MRGREEGAHRGWHRTQRSASLPVPCRWSVRREAGAPWLTRSLCPGLRSPLFCQRMAQCSPPCSGVSSLPFPKEAPQPQEQRQGRGGSRPERPRGRGAARTQRWDGDGIPPESLCSRSARAVPSEEPRPPPSSSPSPAPRCARRLPWEGSARRRPVRSCGQLGPGRARRPPSLARSLAGRRRVRAPPRAAPLPGECGEPAAARRAPGELSLSPAGSAGQLLGTAF